jgi:hypothetical protein
MLAHYFHPDDVFREFGAYQSHPPTCEKDFSLATEFILGHFTSSTFLSSILVHGLLPDIEKLRAIDDRVPSDPKSVYLATTFDRYYLDRATQHHRGDGIIIEVQVFRSALFADEGQLAPTDLKQNSPEMALYLSMCGGACKHKGQIPLSQILSITDSQGSVLYKK